MEARVSEPYDLPEIVVSGANRTHVEHCGSVTRSETSRQSGISRTAQTAPSTGVAAVSGEPSGNVNPPVAPIVGGAPGNNVNVVAVPVATPTRGRVEENAPVKKKTYCCTTCCLILMAIVFVVMAWGSETKWVTYAVLALVWIAMCLMLTVCCDCDDVVCNEIPSDTPVRKQNDSYCGDYGDYGGHCGGGCDCGD